MWFSPRNTAPPQKTAVVYLGSIKSRDSHKNQRAKMRRSPRSKTPTRKEKEAIASYKTSDFYIPNRAYVDRIEQALRDNNLDCNLVQPEKPELLLDSMNKITEIAGWPYPIYRASPHLKIFRHLLEVTTKLQNGKWFGSDGAATCTLVGARGMGKSGSLRRFVDVCGVLFPNVLPVYVSYNRVTTSEMCDTTFSSLLCTELNKMGVVPDKAQNKSDSLMTRIFRGLEKVNMYAFIVIDELDKLYKVRESAVNKHYVHFDEIRTLGGPTAGRVYTVLCGSSSQIHGLISKKAVHVSPNDFPLYTHVQDFNGNKFHPLSVVPSIPNDLDTVRIQKQTDDIKVQRHIAYYTGCNARRIDCFSESTPPDLPPIISENLFLRGLMIKLVSKNRTLLAFIAQNKNGITDHAWETQLAHLNSSDIDNVWVSLDPKWTSNSQIEHELGLLTDRSEIIYDPLEKQVHSISLFVLSSHYRHHVQLAPGFYIIMKRLIRAHLRIILVFTIWCFSVVIWYGGYITLDQLINLGKGLVGLK